MDKQAIDVFERMLADPNSTPDEKRCAMDVLELIHCSHTFSVPEA
jgi:hypothetical protein